MNDKRGRLRVIYSSTLLAAYFGFLLACCFLPRQMAIHVFSDSPTSVAMCLGAAIIAGSLAMTGLYAVSADKASAGARPC
jgi:uncharacterized membrane protein (DUF485 family)